MWFSKEPSQEQDFTVALFRRYRHTRALLTVPHNPAQYKCADVSKTLNRFPCRYTASP